jgi:branched-chain amino acid aminotransferase
MRLNPRLTRGEIQGILSELVRRSGLSDTLLYFACTRGAPPIGSRDEGRCLNKFFAHLQPLVLRGTPDQMRRGLNVTISETIRRIPSDSVESKFKNVHWGDFTRAAFSARDEGYDTVFLTDHSGHVAEGPGFNVVAVIDGGLLAPDANVLEGISCKTMLELAHVLGIPARYGKLSPAMVRNAEEVFITSTSCGLFPVTHIDGRAIGTGAPGPIATRLLNLYYRKKDEGWMMTRIDGV